VNSEARIPTHNAVRYMKQLCRHFAHRVPAEFDDQQGQVTFEFGVCTLKATSDELILHATASEDAACERLEQVIASHLERFAHRDKITVHWTRDDPPGAPTQAGSEIA